MYRTLTTNKKKKTQTQQNTTCKINSRQKLEINAKQRSTYVFTLPRETFLSLVPGGSCLGLHARSTSCCRRAVFSMNSV